MSDKFLFFEEEGEVVGVVTIVSGKWRKKHIATIGGLAVPTLHQGKGVATRMIKELVNILKLEDFIRLQQFVESDNTSAISIYKKMGFKKEGILRGYFKREADFYAIDELIMAKIV